MVEINAYTFDLIPEDLVTPELRLIAENPDSRRYLDGNWMKRMQKGEASVPVIKTAAQIVMEDSINNISRRHGDHRGTQRVIRN